MTKEKPAYENCVYFQVPVEDVRLHDKDYFRPSWRPMVFSSGTRVTIPIWYNLLKINVEKRRFDGQRLTPRKICSTSLKIQNRSFNGVLK